MSTGSYQAFIDTKSQLAPTGGFEPLWIPEFLFPFQQDLVAWAIRRGRGALFEDCGLGKTIQYLVWAENVVRKTGGRVLVITPLAVGQQTIREAERFGIEAVRSRDGRLPARGIVVTNYERLHLFEPADFIGLVCDESSVLKHFTGATQKLVTRFATKIPYRLLCTATAAPNDYMELGTSSEALGELSHSEMLKRFFKESDNKPHRLEEVKLSRAKNTNPDLYAKLAYRVAQQMGRWRLKGHAETPFWRWVSSWARACRRPSDLGYDDGAFMLPLMEERHHIVQSERPPEGMLFSTPVIGLHEEREERRRTLSERCARVVSLVDHREPAVVWCHLNVEGDRLEKDISGSVQVKGSMEDDEKEEAYRAFESGQVRVLVIKPKIGAFGLNWQHCAHVVTFASHSFEQHYQAVRRCWRFGQKRQVTVDIISTESEVGLRENLARKANAASGMFDRLVQHMRDALEISPYRIQQQNVKVPEWLI